MAVTVLTLKLDVVQKLTRKQFIAKRKTNLQFIHNKSRKQLQFAKRLSYTARVNLKTEHIQNLPLQRSNTESQNKRSRLCSQNISSI